MSTVHNPAASGEQYRLAQAVLSGTARATSMSPATAREIVDSTPPEMRSRFARNLRPASEITDRAKRYRAHHPDVEPEPPKQCGFCGSPRFVVPHHINGREEDLDPQNLMWACKSCNTWLGFLYRDHKIGRLTQQYNPSKASRKAQMEEYAAAIKVMRGQFEGDIRKALATIRATPRDIRSAYTAKTWPLRRQLYGDSGRAAMQNPRYEVIIGVRRKGPFESFEEAHSYGTSQARHGVHARFIVKAIDSPDEQEFTRSGTRANPFWKKTTTFSSKLMRGAYDAGYKGTHGVRGDPEFDAWLKKQKESDLDSGFVSQLRQEYRRGEFDYDQRTVAAGTFKGRKIERRGDEFIVPSLDKDSHFESVAEAKRFIAANPGPIERALSGAIETGKKAGRYVDVQLGRALNPAGYKLLEYYYDQKGHKTHGRIESPHGTDWYYLSGRVSREDFLAWLIPAIERRAKENPRKRNPATGAASMYESFHGQPSTEELVMEREERYHEHVASLGICCGVVIETIFGKVAAIGLSGYVFSAREPSPVRSLKGGFVLKDNQAEQTLLTSNEAGTQLFFDGGDQTLDLEALGFKGELVEKESLVIGDVTHISYETGKVFDGKPEKAQYVHEFSEDSRGPLPVLRYDRVNEQLYLDGGSYVIEQPLVGTSPGIEN